MKRFLLSAFLLAVSTCFGQKIDSLKNIAGGKYAPEKRLQAVKDAAGHLSKKNAANVILIVQQGLPLTQNPAKTPERVFLLQTLGKAYFIVGKADSAAKYYDDAFKLASQPGQRYALAEDYSRLAQHYVDKKNYLRAIALFNIVEQNADQTGSRQTFTNALKQLGIANEAMGHYQDALYYLRRSIDVSDSLELAKKISENTPETYSHNFMTEVMATIKQKTETPEEILKTIAIKRSLNDTLALSINYFNLGILYKSRHMYPQALAALENCLSYATKIYYTDMQLSAANELADLYELQGKYSQSVIYLKKRLVINAQRSLGKSKTMEQLQKQYEIFKMQREGELLKQRFEITRRNYGIAAISAVVLLMLVIGFIYYRQARLKQQNIAMQAIIQTEESERRRIAQDLHDSVSQTMSAAKINLSIIGDEIDFKDSKQKARFERAVDMVDAGFKEVRTISHNMMPWALHKTGLARVIDQFITNIDNGTIAVNFLSRGFDEPFSDTVELILYRVLQESVNNVLKHAAATRLDITLIREVNNITLTIEDNGKGFDTGDPQVYSGMGLSNLRSRINFLKGRVEWDSQPGRGTLVSVIIPVANALL